MTGSQLTFERRLLAVFGSGLAAFLILPLVLLVFSLSPGELVSGLRHPNAWPALRLSLSTTALSLCVVVSLGTPLAWSLARARGRFARALEACLELPVVIPPAVAGVALLLAFGRRGLVGSWLTPFGVSLSFSTTAVVLAQIFVSAPYFLQAAVSAFRRVDPRLLLVARSLGASPWRVFHRIGLPLAAPGLIAGAAMSWARSLGEFGATLMFAGNLVDRSQTLPLAVYTALESDLRTAQALSVLLVAVAIVVLVVAKRCAVRALTQSLEAR